MSSKKDSTDYVYLEDVPKQKIPGKVYKIGQFYPEELTLIKDKGHYLYDPRVEYSFDEYMVDGIMRVGLMTTVKCQKIYTDDGLILAVFDGRQGVINAREANIRLESEGLPKIMVKVDIFEGTETDIISRSHIANNHRRSEDPVVAGWKVRMSIARGVPIEILCKDFCSGKATLENWMKLNDLHPDVQKLVSSGQLTQTRALRLRQLNSAQQKERAKEIVSGSAKKTGGDGSNGREHKGVDKRRVKRLHELGAAISDDARLILAWLAGETDDSSVSSLIDFSFIDGAKGKEPKEKKAVSKKIRSDARKIEEIFDDDEIDDDSLEIDD